MFKIRKPKEDKLQQEIDALIHDGLVTQAELAIQSGHVTQLIAQYS